jgi:Sugar phosphate permease
MNGGEIMKSLKSLNFGARGWLLLLYQFISFVAFTVFTNYPMNMLADMYGGAQKISSLYTIGAVIAIVIQILLSFVLSKFKSIRLVGILFGTITMVFAMCIMVIPPFMPVAWQVCYLIVCVFAPMWCSVAVSILVGQWFPTKKGIFMGIATLAFPICNGMMGFFASLVFGGEMPNVFGGFIPYWIVCLSGLVIGFFIKDYPEQHGCYRDNDKNLTIEVAKAMMEQEIENKKTSVWKTGSTLSSRDFWLVVIPMGALLFCAVGMMTQTSAIIEAYGEQMDRFGGFAGIMFMVMIFGIIGSFVIGAIDTAIGTKKAMILACVVMLLSGICGAIHNATGTAIAIILLAIFMGSSSNFMVSAAAQYWRREDFSSVYGCVVPVANLIQAVGPAIIAAVLVAKGPASVFAMVAVFGVLGIVCMLFFSPKHIKEVDDKKRAKAGKPLDDALVGIK